MRRLLARATLALGPFSVAVAASAHDTWIMPASFVPPPGQAITATISAGDGLKALTPPKRQRIQSLDLVDANGRQAYRGWTVSKTSAQLSFGAPAPGVACIAYSTIDIDITIKDKLVDDYLAEIQPPADVMQAWAQQRARGEAWNERYAKDAKTYLRTGNGSAGWPALAVLGQVLEIVPGQDPTRLKPGDRLDVVLQHQGQPLAGVLLRLFSGPAGEETARTDAQGRASFTLARPGRHLITTTLLNLPAAPGAPWTSRFATLGFGVVR